MLFGLVRGARCGHVCAFGAICAIHRLVACSLGSSSADVSAALACRVIRTTLSCNANANGLAARFVAAGEQMRRGRFTDPNWARADAFSFAPLPPFFALLRITGDAHLYCTPYRAWEAVKLIQAWEAVKLNPMA